jgi:hypothetical protein
MQQNSEIYLFVLIVVGNLDTRQKKRVNNEIRRYKRERIFTEEHVNPVGV